MLRKYCLIAAIIAVASFGFFYESLLNTGIRFYIGSSSERLNVPLTYSTIDSSPHFLVYNDFSASLKGGTIQAKKLILEHHIHPFSRHIDLKIHLEHPCINVEKELVDIESIFNNLAGGSALFTTAGEISCTSGSLSLCPKNQEKIYFDFNHQWQSSLLKKSLHSGSYFFNLSEKDTTSTLQFFFTAHDPANVKLNANLQKVEAEKLAETVKAFIPELASWNFKKGIMNGEFSFEIANAKFAEGKGELVITDLEAEEKKLGIFASINKAIFRTDAQTGNASLDILDDGFLTFNDGAAYASFKDFNGKIAITDADHLEMNLKGIWEDKENPLKTELSGTLHLDEFLDAFVKISLNSIDGQTEPAFISIDAKRLGGSAALQIDLQKFGPKQFHFWQKAIEKVFPDLNPITYHSGTLNALLTVTLNKEKLESLRFKNIEAANVFFILKNWDAAFGADKVLGQFAVNFLHFNPLDSLNADIHIENGQASLTGMTSEFWHFNHIETRLSIRNGIVQKSSASVELAGLKGSAVVNSFSEKEILCFELAGNAMDLKPFLPVRMQAGIDKKMAQDNLVVNAAISKIAQGIQVNGKLAIRNEEVSTPPISFGFNIERATEEFLQPNFYENSKTLLTAFDQLSTPYAHAFFNLEERLLLKEAGIQGFVLRQGWFKAANINLEKFLSPFLFIENNFSLRGVSNFEGAFDHLGLAIRYDARSLVLENDSLNIDVEKVFTSSSQLPGFHYFDFISGKHFGELPLNNGSYFDKNSGLFFSEVNTRVLFEGKKIHVLDIDAFCNGLYFGGLINIDYSNPQKGYFDLEILINTLHGKVSQVQHFFSHFDKPLFFKTLPLEGDIALKNEGCSLLFNFEPKDFKLKTVVEASISDGIFTPENFDLSVQDISVNFLYNSEECLLHFSDLQGTLISAKPSAIDEYTIHSNAIHFSNYETNEALFDIWVKDQNRDLIRLAGTTATQLNENNEKEIVFSFDPTLTHFGEIHPKKIALSLADWTKIAKAKLDFSFRLSTLLYDLQRFGKSGLLFSSPHFLKNSSNLKNAGGDCEVSLNYDSTNSAFNFSLQGQNVTFDKYSFKNVSLLGKNQDKIWTIDQLQLDQLTLAAEFTKIESVWKANFLGLRYGKSILAGMEGKFDENEKSAKGHINLLEINLEKLKEWPELASFVSDYSPQGILRGQGEINFEFASETPFCFDIDVEASLTNGKLKNIHFADSNHFMCSYSSEKGFTFNDVVTAIALNDKIIPLKFKSIQFETSQENLLFKGCCFDISSDLLPDFVSNVQKDFPNLLSDNVADVLKNLKKSGSLIGELSVRKTPVSTDFSVTLNEGSYYLFGKEHALKDFEFHSSPEGMTFSSLYQFNHHTFRMKGEIDALNCDHGKLVLTDSMHRRDPKISPLAIQWKTNDQDGFVIESANGIFGGMHIQLTDSSKTPSTRSALHLEGKVITLSNQFKDLFEEGISEQIVKWQIGQGYVLQGTFVIAKEDIKDGDRPINFYGSLSGEDFHLKGYQLSHLQSQLLFGPQTIQISDVSITDAAGALYIDQITIAKEGEKSHLSIPELNIQEFRPSLLAEVGKEYQNPKKPLVVRDLTIHDIKGYLGFEESFTGKGSLYFNNPVKKHLQNTIFAFPAEILTRIGLDLSVLTPVTGTINYEIRDGKIFLTKFKDIYSDSRLSRFYLPNSRTPSYMDFDGNLNIQVKMKQHTLIFKLAELFTVTIQGNLQKPTYTLLRQKPLRRSEVIASNAQDIDYQTSKD